MRSSLEDRRNIQHKFCSSVTQLIYNLHDFARGDKFNISAYYFSIPSDMNRDSFCEHLKGAASASFEKDFPVDTQRGSSVISSKAMR